MFRNTIFFFSCSFVISLFSQLGVKAPHFSSRLLACALRPTKSSKPHFLDLAFFLEADFLAGDALVEVFLLVVLLLEIGDLGFAVVGFFIDFFFLLGEEAFTVERVLLAVESADVVPVDGFLGLEGAGLGLVVVTDLTGDLDRDLDLDRDRVRVDDVFFFRFRFNFSFRRGVTLYEALILVRVPSSTPFLRAERK